MSAWYSAKAGFVGLATSSISQQIVICKDLNSLAPLFGAAVKSAIKECNDNGFDAIVFESYRSQETQAAYYARGRTIIPPRDTVTNAKTNSNSWHGYNLAVDIISKSKEWGAPLYWFESVAAIFKGHGCKWGGDWKMKDLPHMQWGTLKPSPSDLAKTLLAQGKLEQLWKLVDAI